MPRILRTSRPRPGREAPDLTWYVGGTSAALGLVLFALASIPADAKTLSHDSLWGRNHYVAGNLKPLVEKEDETPAWAQKKKAELGENRGTRERGAEGKAGKRDSRKTDGRLAVKGDPTNPDPHLGKSAADLARTAGILGTMAHQTSAMTSIFGRGDALGNAAQDALGNLVGTQVGEAYGVGGWGLVGPHRGGGGMGPGGTYGFGNLGTIGLCRGPNCGPGSGHGFFPGLPSRDRAHIATGPDVFGGQAKTSGGLDRDIIRRTIRSHIKEVKFCYEQELMRRPGLYGRVSIKFAITGTGVVSSAAVDSSTVGDAKVERCIANAVQRWEFPRPTNGGVVLVTYPFVLQAAGTR